MKTHWSLIILALFVITGVPRADVPKLERASQIDIAITDGGYAPQVTHILLGTTVEWTCLEGVHTTTSRDGLWDSGIMVPDDTFTYTFDEPGVFYYYDTIHLWPLGTIQVVYSLATIDIRTNKKTYMSGDTIRIGVDLSNPGEAVQVGIYIYMRMPGGRIRTLLEMPSVTLPAGYSYSNDNWFETVLPPLPRGEYSVHAKIYKVPEEVLVDNDSEIIRFGEAFQGDWSGGPGVPGPSGIWGESFDSSNGVAWRSIESQLSLSSDPRPEPLGSSIAFDAGLPNSIAAGDLNGDGLDDVLTTDPIYNFNPSLGAIYWWQRQEDGTWSQHTVSGDFYGAKFVNTADVDSDGDLDVLGAAYYGDDPGLGRDGRFSWFENLNGDASSWEQHLVGDMFWGAQYIDAGDLDGDGDIDLVGGSDLTDGVYEQESDITWFENLDGEGDFWGQHDLDLFFPHCSVACPVDLDRDGDLDIVAGNSDDIGQSNFTWWRNEKGDGSVWTKIIIPYEFWGPGYLDVGDLDGDGDLDIMGGGYNSNQVGWWENRDGQGTSWLAWFITPQPSGQGLELADLDGISWNNYWVIWIVNSGSGFGWDVRTVAYGILPWAAVGDLEDDGKLDVVMCSEDYAYSDDQIRAYDISQFSDTGELYSTILNGGTDPGWGIMTWDANVPEATSLTIEVRASNDPGNMGPYVPVPSSGTDLGDIIDPNVRYLQYRTGMSSIDSAVSPVLRELNVTVGEGPP
jgi:plastocyanin